MKRIRTMKRLLLPIIALCLLIASCETNTNKTQSRPTKVTQEKPATAEETAHAHGCITVDEFKDMRFSYVIEKNLPCLVYLERFHVNDIISKLPEEKILFDPIIDITTSVSINGYDESLSLGDCDSETGWSFQSEWCGTPSERNNECWIEGLFKGISPLSSIYGYIGVDKTQVDWAIRKAKSVKYDFQDVENTPIIIKVYQTRSGGSIKSDLVAILNEE